MTRNKELADPKILYGTWRDIDEAMEEGDIATTDIRCAIQNIVRRLESLEERVEHIDAAFYTREDGQ